MPRQLSALPHHPFAASRPTSARALARPLAVGLGMALAFVTIFLSALHSPTPHDLPVAVVGPAHLISLAEQGLDAAAPGAFEVTFLATTYEAEQALRSREVYGVLDLTVARTAEISVSGANGAGVTSAVEGALTATADQLGRSSRTTDAVPLPPGDSRGLSVFYFVFGLALSGYLFALTLHQAASGASLGVRLSAALLFSGAAGLALATIVDVGFEALTGHFWAIAGISAMISLAVSTATSALTRLLGGAGIGLAGLIAIVIGNATSGGALNHHFLPDGWRGVSQVLPTGAGVTGLLDVQYFDAAGLAPVLLTLTAWIAVSLLLLVALPVLRLDAVHRSHQAARQRVAVAPA